MRRTATRKSYSCLECSRRKLRCSKTIPCTACVDRGIGHLCRLRPQAPDNNGRSLAAARLRRRETNNNTLSSTAAGGTGQTGGAGGQPRSADIEVESPRLGNASQADALRSPSTTHGAGADMTTSYDRTPTTASSTPAAARLGPVPGAGTGVGASSMAQATNLNHQPMTVMSSESTSLPERSHIGLNGRSRERLVDHVEDDAAVILEFLTLSRQRVSRVVHENNNSSNSPEQHRNSSFANSMANSGQNTGGSINVNAADLVFSASQIRAMMVYHAERIAWTHNVVHMPAFQAQCELAFSGQLIIEKAWLAMYYAIIAVSELRRLPLME